MIRIFAEPWRRRAFAVRAFILLGALALLVYSAAALAATATSRQTGNWNANATWSLTRTGTVTATVGSPAVTGVGTLFTTELAVNDVITNSADVVLGTVKSITSDTELVLQANAAANIAGQPYAARKAPSATDSAVIANLAAAHTVTVTANATAAGVTFAGGAQASTLRINGAVLLTVNGNATVNAPTATVTKRIDVAPAGRLTVNGNMILIGGGTGQIAELRLGGNAATTVTVTGSLTGAGGGTLSSRVNIIFLGTGTLNVGGDFASGASFTPFSGTVVYNGGADQSVSPQFYNILRIAKPGGNAHLNGSSVSTNALQLDGGNVITGVGTLTIVNSPCTNANVIRTAGHVVGNLRKIVPVGTPTCTFQVGSVNYTPVVVSFASVSAAFNLTASATGTEHPQIAASTLDPARNVSRYWTLSSPGKSFTSYSATFQFTPADVDPGANPLVFRAERFASGAWSVPGLGSRTATSTQATGITTFGDFAVGEEAPPLATPGSFNAFETSTAAGAINGRIFTKLAGVGFDLSVVSINAGAQQATFSADVKVELLGNSATGVALNAENCPATSTVVQTIASTPLVNGRSTVTFAPVSRAWRDVRVRISWPTAGSAVVGCSTDNFAIRPVDFSSVNSNMTNGGAIGLPRARAGDAFTLTAVAGAGYDGTPLIDPAQVAAHAGAVQAGVLAGAFSPAAADTGTAAGIAFTYSEVGNFTLRAGGVYDSGFAAVDSAAGDCTNDFSNALVGGRYGCLIANSTLAGPFGRFTPDHFDVTLNVPAFSAACGAEFTYVGQAFSYATAPVITVTARNAAALGNAITRNYTGPNDGSSWWKITSTSLTGKAYGQLPASPALTVAPAAPDPAIAPGGDGTGTLTFNSGTGFFFARTSALAPFDAEISLAINVIDADNVAHAGNPVKFGDATAGNGIAFATKKAMRFGRLRLQNANGSQLIALSMPFETQYWTGTAFVTNTLDNCTAITAANVGLGNYQGNLAAGETTVTVGTALAAGRGTLRLSAPGPGNNGAVDVVVNLGSVTTIDAVTTCLSWTAPAPAPVGADLSHLRGQWCGSNFDRSPTARATFGVFRNTDRFIYQRENY